MRQLFTIKDTYESIQNVKQDLIFINQTHILRFDLVNNSKQVFPSSHVCRHLRFFKSANGEELELFEEQKKIKVRHRDRIVMEYPEPIEGFVESGNLARTNLHEYVTGEDLDVVVVTLRVGPAQLDQEHFSLRSTRVDQRSAGL